MDSDGTALTVLTALTPVLVVLLGGFGWLYKHERERRTAAEHQVSERKYQAYVTLLGIFFDQFKALRQKKQLPQQQLVDRMFDANKELMLYASDDVLSLYHDWLDESRRGVVDMEQFWGADRRDSTRHGSSENPHLFRGSSETDDYRLRQGEGSGAPPGANEPELMNHEYGGENAGPTAGT